MSKSKPFHDQMVSTTIKVKVPDEILTILTSCQTYINLLMW